LKDCSKGLLTLVLVTIFSGCSSTDDIAELAASQPIKYESRCGIHENTREENLKMDKSASLLYVSPPKYPVYAALNGIEGYVRLEFDISENGKTTNINVIESFPGNVFDKVAVIALSGWQYESNASQCTSVQLEFKLS
jgi:TonB family protein